MCRCPETGCQVAVDLTDWGRLLPQTELEDMEILAAESAVSAVRFQWMLDMLLESAVSCAAS